MTTPAVRRDYGFAIGPIDLPQGLISAPMVGNTNLAYRLLVVEQGCDLVYTEMVKAQPLLRRNDKTEKYLERHPDERLVGAQVCGADPELMARAAADIESRGFPTVDLNMGCPVRKVMADGSGAMLMKDPAKVERIVGAMSRAVGIPVTVKMRAGWDEDSRNAPVVARAAEQGGAAAVAVHGRTRDRGHKGQVDLPAIARVKETVSVPVIGNGGIHTPEDAERMLVETGCDGVMIGRGGLGNPWLFRAIRHQRLTGELPPPPSAEELRDTMRRHFGMVSGWIGEFMALRLFRRYGGWYLKGLPGAARLRHELHAMERVEDLERIVQEGLEAWATRGPAENPASCGGEAASLG